MSISTRLQTRAKALLHSEAPSLSSDFPRKETIKHLHESLTAFGSHLFEFFQMGFEGAKGYRLEPSVAYPEEYVLNTILAQVSHDFGAIQKACQQRSDASLAERLDIADQLAYLSLQPAVEHGVLPVSTVLTYFHKSPNVRVIPYAPVALVGIPFSACNPANNYDLLATPHEVGHYVYRHGRIPDKSGNRLRTGLEHTIERSFPAEERWVLQWLEEIFADVYGCLIATEAMTESFRDILISHSGRQFVGDTVKHPIPAVRMYVYTTALQKFGYGAIAERFLDEWGSVLEQRGKPDDFEIDGASEAISFDVAKEIFEKTIQSFADLTKLESLESLKRLKTYPTWGEGGGSAFDAFVDTLNQQNRVHIPELQIRDDKIYVDREGEYDRSNRRLGDTNTWIDIINIGEDGKTLEAPIPPVAWGAIFDSLDWTVEGPHSRT